MPQLKLTGLLAYKNYFADIAAQHVDIKGYKWGEKKDVMNDNASEAPVNYLWAMPYDSAQYIDNLSDNAVKTKVATVAYLEVRDSALFTDEDAQFERCEGRIEEILARILRDKKGSDVGGEWTMIVTNINSWKTKPIYMKVGSTAWLGYELEISFSDNTNLEYNPAKWRDS